MTKKRAIENKISMEGDLIFRGSEAEVKAYKREIDFTYADDISKKYQRLIPAHQDLVVRIMSELVDNSDNFGYNLSAIFKDYKIATPSVSRSRINKVLAFNVKLKKAKTPKNTRVGNMFTWMFKQASIPMEKTDYSNLIKALCDQLLLSESLIYDGIGIVRTIKDEWLEKYLDANNAVVNTDLRDIKETEKWTTLESIQRYERFLKRHGKLAENESILEEHWAVIKYSGLYRIFMVQKKRQDELNAIERLIDELLADELATGRMSNIPFEENVN